MNLRSVVAAGARVHPPGWLSDDLCYVKRHLVHCLEMHYGDLSAAVVQPDEAVLTLRKIAELTEQYR